MKRIASSGTTSNEVDRQLDDTAYDNVKIVADSITTVVAVGEAVLAGDLDVVTTNIADIVTVSANIADVAAVAADAVDIGAVAADLVNINSVAADLVNIDIVATNIGDVNKYTSTYFHSHVDETALNTWLIANSLTATDGDLYFDTTLNAMRVYGLGAWSNSLTLTEASISTLTNKTLNDISNDINANALHYPIKASGAISRGDVIYAVDTLGDGTIVAAVHNNLGIPAIGISDATLSNNGLGKALTVGTYKNYDATGLTVGQILYPNGTGGLTNTPVIADGNYNQPSAYVAEINGGNAQLIINFHSAHESANLVSIAPIGNIVATNVQSAIQELDSEKQAVSEKGVANGYAGLDANGQVPAGQLPSYVDDVLEVATYSSLPVTGEASKIYIVVADETQGGDTSTYRWAGSVYAIVSNSLTATDIEALYEGLANTNKYTDAEKAKVGHISVTQAVDLDSVETNSDASKLVTDKVVVSAVTSVTFNTDGTMTVVIP